VNVYLFWTNQIRKSVLCSIQILQHHTNCRSAPVEGGSQFFRNIRNSYHFDRVKYLYGSAMNMDCRRNVSSMNCLLQQLYQDYHKPVYPLQCTLCAQWDTADILFPRKRSVLSAYRRIPVSCFIDFTQRSRIRMGGRKLEIEYRISIKHVL
jgi:hypothetical protein